MLLNQLLLSHFSFLLTPFDLLLNELFAFRSVIFPDDFEDFVGIIGCDRRSSFFVFDSELNELVPESSFGVVGKPVVKVPAADSPDMGDSLGDNE